MTDSQTNRLSVFIEKIFPVTLLNQQVYYEHGGNPFKGLHRWYSRKPLSFSRASVLGSLLPDSVTRSKCSAMLFLGFSFMADDGGLPHHPITADSKSHNFDAVALQE